MSGRAKAAILKRVLRGPREPDRLPAQAILPRDGRAALARRRRRGSALDSPGANPQLMETTMTTATTALRERRAWKALQAHHAKPARRPPAHALRRGPAPRRALRARGRRPLFRLLEAPDHGRDAAAAARAGRGVRPARAHRRACSAARRSTPRRGAPCCTSRCARRANAELVLDGEDVVAEGPRACSIACSRSRSACAAAAGAVTPASASATS